MAHRFEKFEFTAGRPNIPAPPNEECSQAFAGSISAADSVIDRRHKAQRRVGRAQRNFAVEQFVERHYDSRALLLDFRFGQSWNSRWQFHPPPRA
jgi:hypothetical protein